MLLNSKLLFWKSWLAGVFRWVLFCEFCLTGSMSAFQVLFIFLGRQSHSQSLVVPDIFWWEPPVPEIWVYYSVTSPPNRPAITFSPSVVMGTQHCIRQVETFLSIFSPDVRYQKQFQVSYYPLIEVLRFIAADICSVPWRPVWMMKFWCLSSVCHWGKFTSFYFMIKWCVMWPNSVYLFLKWEISF